MKNDLKILLVDPKAPSYGLNIALALLGARLKQSGFGVKLLDQNNRHVKDTANDLHETIVSFKPDVVGFSVLYITQKEVNKLIAGLKKKYAGHIIIGGPQITLLEKEVFKYFDVIDAAFVGEAEESLILYCSRMAKGVKFPGKSIPGIIYKADDIICYIKETDKPAPIDNELIPDFSLFDLKEIERYPLLTSRGCPYSCTYCFRTHRHDWRSRTPDSIIHELENAIDQYNIKEVWIHDDSFNINSQRVIDICKLWKEKFPKLKWACAGIRADHVTRELAEAMNKAGCYSVGVGIETLDADVFKNLKKGESIGEILSGIKCLQDAGINVRGNFIIGLPGDTFQKAMNTFYKAKKLNLKSQSWTLLLPIPGTEIYDIIYSSDDVKKLNSYMDIDMIWMPEMPDVKCGFEFPEYTAEEKLKAYYKINTMLGFSFVRHPHRKILRIIEAIVLIFKYAPLSSPMLIFRLIAKYIKRFVTGETIITSLKSGLKYYEE